MARAPADRQLAISHWQKQCQDRRALKQPDGVKPGNWIQTMPGKGWSTLLRLYSPLEPFFTKEWQRMNLEGIASKRRQSAYRSGPTRDWLKIKTASWRAANRDRWELFEKQRDRPS